MPFPEGTLSNPAGSRGFVRREPSDTPEMKWPQVPWGHFILKDSDARIGSVGYAQPRRRTASATRLTATI